MDALRVDWHVHTRRKRAPAQTGLSDPSWANAGVCVTSGRLLGPRRSAALKFESVRDHHFGSERGLKLGVARGLLLNRVGAGSSEKLPLDHERVAAQRSAREPA
jgi:hypothetical protein